jgi:hypothetical protein
MKNRILKAGVLLGLTASAALSQVGIHPSYSWFNMNGQFSPGNLFYGSNALPLVGAMDVFPDGRVAIAEWGVPASVFILSGLNAGNTNIQVKRFAKGLDNVMGLKIVDGVIYVLEREGLTQLLDTDGDGLADQYNAINQAFPSNTSMLNLAYDLSYHDGAFWAAMSADVAAGGYSWGSSQKPNPQALPGRATLYKLKLDGTAEAWASGFRNPNGMGHNGSDLFVTDNEGSWTPTSKLIHVKQNRFYGHRSNPPGAIQTMNNNVQSPPVIWTNWESGSGFTQSHSTGRSIGNPIVLKQGRYAGQFIIPDFPPDYAANRIFRVFVERIDGELQGVILPFVKGGTTTGPHRIQELADGSLVIGMVGSNCCWGGRNGMGKGFNVLRPNPSAPVPFEVLAVRSTGPTTFEVEFTKPPLDANLTSKYSLRTWRHIAAETYGGGRNQSPANLTVTSATVLGDGKKVSLTVSGLPTVSALEAEGGTRLVKFVFNGIAASNTPGDTLWTHFAVYTLNKYGPGTDYQAVSIKPAAARATQAGYKLTAGGGHHTLNFLWDNPQPRRVALYDMKGTKKLELRNVTGSSVRLETGAFAKGLYVVRVSIDGQNNAGASALPLMIQ